MHEITRSAPPPEPFALRLFVVDRESGAALEGVLVEVSAGTLDDREAGQGQRIAGAQTDALGYASIKLNRAVAAARSQLSVTYGGQQGEALVLEVADLLAG